VSTLQWTRVDYGRVWHITFGDGPILCNSELAGLEFTRGEPPRGSFPCQRCMAAVIAAYETVLNVRTRPVPEPTRRPQHVHGVPQEELEDVASEVVDILVSNAAEQMHAEDLSQ
jgi:hypothetical protein